MVPFLVAAAAIDELGSSLENAWVSVFPFFAEPAGYSLDTIFQSQEVLRRLEGVW